jgi:hypothetical protein
MSELGLNPGMELVLDVALILLLIATLFHALRLERALGLLKRDRSALEALVASFNASSTQAELSIAQLREAAESAGRHLSREIERGGALKADIVFLNERAERLADRLEADMRQARALGVDGPGEPGLRAVRPPEVETTEAIPVLRSQAERDLLKALRAAR